MNKKIQELAIEAGLYDEQLPEEVPLFTESFEKFGELIVKECIKAVQNTDRTHIYTSYDKGVVDATISKSVQSIKDHFKE